MKKERMMFLSTVSQEALLAPYIAPKNVAPAIQETTSQASEGVAQDSDPSKSLSHALGLIEASASSSPRHMMQRSKLI